MADLAPIKVRFDVDTSGLNAVSTAATNMGDNVKSKFSSIGTGAGIALGAGVIAGTAVAARAATGFLGDAIDSASGLNETISKTTQIFGQDAVPALEAWASTASDAFGQSKQQALDAASTFAMFGKSAGLQGTELTGFSKELTQLATDFASFADTTPEEAITAIGAALRGENEPIRKYSVLLDDATLKARALALGIADGTSALTPQQKVLAAHAEIMAQTTLIQGDFARTSDGLANTQRSLKANFENVKAEVGTALLPVMLDLLNMFKEMLPTIKDTIIPIVKDLAGQFKDNLLPAIKENLPTIKDILKFLGDNAGAITAVAASIAVIVPLIKGYTLVQTALNLAMAANPIGLIILAIAGLVAGIVYLATQTTFFQDTWANLSKTFENFSKNVGTWADEAWKNITNFFDGIGQWLGNLGNVLYNVASTIWGEFVRGTIDVLFALPSLVAGIMKDIPFLSQLGNGMQITIGGVKGGMASALGAGQSNTNVTNNYNVTAQGLTVGQVQREATRRTRLNAPIGGY